MHIDRAHSFKKLDLDFYEKRRLLKDVYRSHDKRMQDKLGAMFGEGYAGLLCRQMRAFTSSGKHVKYPTLDLIASYLGVKTSLCG